MAVILTHYNTHESINFREGVNISLHRCLLISTSAHLKTGCEFVLISFLFFS